MNKYYYNDDRTAIGVLVSPGFGTGWSTDNMHGINLAIDRAVINYWLNSAPKTPPEDIEEALGSLGYYGLNLYGWKNLELRWVPVGATFRINNYDGAEAIEIFNIENWVSVE